MIGVPPCSATAAATAAPRPDEPPVTTTVPSGRNPASPVAEEMPVSSADTRDGLLDDPGRGPPGDIGNDDGTAAPLGEHGRLRQLGRGVVPALRPQMRRQ